AASPTKGPRCVARFLCRLLSLCLSPSYLPGGVLIFPLQGYATLPARDAIFSCREPSCMPVRMAQRSPFTTSEVTLHTPTVWMGLVHKTTAPLTAVST